MKIIEIYLWANAFIYVLFALWCTIKKEQTSFASGFTKLSKSGWSEYLVIYGGLQLGLAFFFAYLALHVELYQVGAIFAMLLYVPIVTYRIITIYHFRPVKRTTLAIGLMEIILLAGAIASFTLQAQ